MKKINLTIELTDNKEILDFEHWIRHYVNVVDFTILPDTKDLYANDSYFKKITKDYYRTKQIRNDYINKKMTE